MRFLEKTYDGGKDSPVDAYFLFESKRFGSIALLRFNKGGRENFHTHAFNAWTWFLFGELEEELFTGEKKKYSFSLIPKLTKRDNNHRVLANKTSWCFTIRGPWKDTWTEDNKETGQHTTLTHGRVVVNLGDNR